MPISLAKIQASAEITVNGFMFCFAWKDCDFVCGSASCTGCESFANGTNLLQDLVCTMNISLLFCLFMVQEGDVASKNQDSVAEGGRYAYSFQVPCLLYWARPVELLKVFEFGGGAGPGKKSFESLQF